MFRTVIGVVLAALSPGLARAQAVAPPCVPIASAARSPGQISIPPMSLNLPGVSPSLSTSATRDLQRQFRPEDALVSVPDPRGYTGASAERVAQMVHARILEPGVFHSAFPDGPAPLENGRWAGLYSDGGTDLLVVTDPAAGWPPNGVLLSPSDVDVVSQLLARHGVVVTTYAGRGVVQAVCGGRTPSITPFVASTPKQAVATGPRGCTDIAMSPNERTSQPDAVPQVDVNLSGAASVWPAPVQAALRTQMQDQASQVVLGPLAGYDALPDEVARRYASRLVEREGWRAAYPADIRPIPGGGWAGLFSNGKVDALMLAYPGAEFPPDEMPVAAADRTRLRDFASNHGRPFGTVVVRYDGRGLLRAACAGRLDAVFRPE